MEEILHQIKFKNTGMKKKGSLSDSPETTPTAGPASSAEPVTSTAFVLAKVLALYVTQI